MNSSDSWECPKCQTLNASGTNCYSCGEPRPGVRDHPAVADAGSDLLAEEEADAHLDQLEIDLSQVSINWTAPSVERTYDSGDDGEQEYEDEAMIFEEHGYSKLVERPDNAINATFTLGTGPS